MSGWCLDDGQFWKRWGWPYSSSTMEHKICLLNKTCCYILNTKSLLQALHFENINWLKTITLAQPRGEKQRTDQQPTSLSGLGEMKCSLHSLSSLWKETPTMNRTKRLFVWYHAMIKIVCLKLIRNSVKIEITYWIKKIGI